MQTALRYYYQPGGACYGNGVKYGGKDGQFLNIESATNPLRGIEAINVQDPKTAGRFKRVGRNRSAPDYPTASVQWLQRRGYVPEQLLKARIKPYTFYAISGDTKDLTDFVNGWNNYVKIYSFGELTEANEGGGAWDGGEQIQDEEDFTFERIYVIGPMGFDEKAATQVYSEAVDVVYGSYGDGTEAVYAVTDNTIASAGQAPSIHYTLNAGVTWTEAAITGSVAADSPEAIVIVGQYLVVLFDNTTTGGYYYAEINPDTGIPGTFTKVTTGFVTGKAPKDIYAPDGRSIIIVGEGGYIYKSSNLTAGVVVLDAGGLTTNQLNRVDGTEDGTLVAVGNSDTVLYSPDRGNTWYTSPSATGGAANLNGVAVKDSLEWWIVDASGNAYVTINGGTTWTDSGVLPATITAAQDVVFITDEVGFILCSTASPAAVIYTTWNGGNDWTAGAPRIIATPTADRFNRLAYPDFPEPAIQTNFVAIAGLAGNGSDGIILLGTPKSL